MGTFAWSVCPLCDIIILAVHVLGLMILSQAVTCVRQAAEGGVCGVLRLHDGGAEVREAGVEAEPIQRDVLEAMAEVSVKSAQPTTAGHLTAALLGASCSAFSLFRVHLGVASARRMRGCKWCICQSVGAQYLMDSECPPVWA